MGTALVPSTAPSRRFPSDVAMLCADLREARLQAAIEIADREGGVWQAEATKLEAELAQAVAEVRSMFRVVR